MRKTSAYLIRITIICFLGCAGIFARAAQVQPVSAPPLELTVVDLSPKFMNFYDEATRGQASSEQRWALWQKYFDFAAVPSTPDGQAVARQMLDRAWPLYPAALDRIRQGAAGLSPDPRASVRAVADLLKPAGRVKLTVAVYVGAFEENAFTTAQNGMIVVAVPLEAAAEARGLKMTHEMVHAVHIGMGSFSGAWPRTVGATVLTEGLAMRVTQSLNPDLSTRAVIEERAGWLAEADGKRLAILKDIQGVLNSNSRDDVRRYTVGKGPAGIEREAYYVGWLVLGYWLEQGLSFGDIARIPEAQMPARVGEVIQKLLAQAAPPLHATVACDRGLNARRAGSAFCGELVVSSRAARTADVSSSDKTLRARQSVGAQGFSSSAGSGRSDASQTEPGSRTPAGRYSSRQGGNPP
jgi:hypothetical protein